MVPGHHGTISVDKRRRIRNNLSLILDEYQKLAKEVNTLRERKSNSDDGSVPAKRQQGKAKSEIEEALGTIARALGCGMGQNCDGTRIVSRQGNQEKMSYALAASRATPRQTHEITVEGTEKGPLPEDIIKTVKGMVKPEEEGIRVNSIYQTKHGKVKINSATREDAERLAETLRCRAGGRLTVTARKPLRPRVAIKFVPREFEEEQLLSCILTQNEAGKRYKTVDELAKDIRAVGFIKNKWKPETKMIIAEVSPELRREIINKPMHVAWCEARVEDYLVITQCFRCHDIGHRSGQCNEKGQVCSRCGGQNLRGECHSERPSCVLCKRAGPAGANGEGRDHEANQGACPIMQRALHNLKQRIDYGQP